MFLEDQFSSLLSKADRLLLLCVAVLPMRFSVLIFSLCLILLVLFLHAELQSFEVNPHFPYFLPCVDVLNIPQ